MPTIADLARADQYHAAVTDAAGRAAHAAHTLGVSPVDSGDAWLMAEVGQTIAAIRDREVMTCAHLADRAPRVMYAVLWAPGIVVCADCTSLLTPTDIEDSTCDRCRQVSPTIRPHLTTVGPILLGFGLCPACTTIVHRSTHTPRDAQ